MFKHPEDLQPVYDEIIRTAIFTVKPDNIAAFLGKRITHNCKQEVGTNYNQRILGTRIKHHITKQITDLTNLLLDDNTDISKNTESSADSDGKDSPSAKKENAPDTASNAFLFATNSDLQDLFFDCTPDEATLLIENARLLKDYIHKSSCF